MLEKVTNAHRGLKQYADGLPESWSELKLSVRETGEVGTDLLYTLYRLLVIVGAKNIETAINIPAIISGGERSTIARKIVSAVAPRRERNNSELEK